jgi:hypothetical protein
MLQERIYLIAISVVRRGSLRVDAGGTYVSRSASMRHVQLLGGKDDMPKLKSICYRHYFLPRDYFLYSLADLSDCIWVIISKLICSM